MNIPRRALFAAPLLAAASPLPPAARPIDRLSTKWWRERHQQKLAELRSKPVDLVFLGDSITQNWEHTGPEPWQNFQPIWQRLYGDRHAVNLGYPGDATSHLLWRIANGELDNIRPKAAVILIGANNLGRLHWPPAESIQGIETVVEETRRHLPATRILLLSVLPSIRSDWATVATDTINAALATRFANTSNLVYRDVGHIFRRNHATDPAQFYDPLLKPPEPPLHPTAAAQERMALDYEPTLAAMLGDRVRS